MEQKIFMWFATNSYGEQPWQGPHYQTDVDKIGKKLYHNLRDLLKMDISDAMKKKLQNAKPGKKITLHSLHANGNLMLKCLSETKVKQVKELDKLKKKSYRANLRAKELSSEYEKQFSKILKR